MRSTVAAALMFLLVSPVLGAADEGESDVPDRTKLGEFVPSSQPFPAPEVSLADPTGQTVELSAATRQARHRQSVGHLV